MLGFIFYVALLFGIPALLIVAGMAALWGAYRKQTPEAEAAADPQLQHKLKRRKIFLIIGIVIGSVFVIALVVMAVLLTTAVAFM